MRPMKTELRLPWDEKDLNSYFEWHCKNYYGGGVAPITIFDTMNLIKTALSQCEVDIKSMVKPLVWEHVVDNTYTAKGFGDTEFEIWLEEFDESEDHWSWGWVIPQNYESTPNFADTLESAQAAADEWNREQVAKCFESEESDG